MTTDPKWSRPPKPVVVMLHGRGAGPENILDLVPRLDRPQFQYVAPAAPNRTWYPFSFMAEIEKNEPHLSNALAQVGQAVADAESNGVPRHKIVLLGFSQGACLATEFTIRNAARWGGLIAFSGGFVGPAGTRATEGTEIRATEGTEITATEGPDSSEAKFGGTPMFFGCSDVDAHVPESRVRESAALCGRMGATVTTKIYPGMGHVVSDDEIAQARLILDAVTAGS